MNDPRFDEDQRDHFGEIVNIAMGKTGAALGQAFDGFIHLEVPEIRAVDAADIGQTRQRLALNCERISILHQQFVGELAGQIAVICGGDGDGSCRREESLLELGNALASTFILDIGSALAMRTAMHPPRIAAFDVPAQEGAPHLFRDMPTGAGKALLIDILFHLEAHALPFELMIILLPHCLPGVRRALAMPECALSAMER